MTTLEKDTFCSFCGTRYASAAWPRHCERCGYSVWRNPIPVAVVVQPVGKGVLVIRRGIEPKSGELALPGGYVDDKETWEEAASREMHEETDLIIRPEDFRLFRVRSSTLKTQMLVLAIGPHLEERDLPPFRPNNEVTERVVVTAPRPLAFPTHTEALRDYLINR